MAVGRAGIDCLRFASSRGGNGAARKMIPGCQSYFVLPLQPAAQLVPVPRNRLGYRSQKDTSPERAERSPPEEAFHSEDSPELLVNLRSLREDVMVVVRNSSYPLE